MIASAPDGCGKNAAFNPSALHPDGKWVRGALYAVVPDEAGNHHLFLPQGQETARPAFIIPFDEHFVLRMQSLQRFYRRLTSNASGPLPRPLRLTSYQIHRCALMLRAWDGTRAGASHRDIAGTLFHRDVLTLRAVDWKNAPERRRIHRLLKAARAMVEGGYRRLLRGGT